MNEKLCRTQFDQMETPEKLALMDKMAVRYDMTFLGLQPFDRWGQSCTTGVLDVYKRQGQWGRHMGSHQPWGS